MWKDPQNGMAYPAFDMTQDGFSLLVMGYTGPKAMEFKVRDIERFNAMEAELSKQSSQPQVPQTYVEALRAAADAEEQPLITYVRDGTRLPAESAELTCLQIVRIASLQGRRAVVAGPINHDVSKLVTFLVQLLAVFTTIAPFLRAPFSTPEIAIDAPAAATFVLAAAPPGSPPGIAALHVVTGPLPCGAVRSASLIRRVANHDFTDFRTR